MEKKVYNIEIIGFGLALLYATSCLMFIRYLKIPGFEQYTILYSILFCLLFVGSLAVVWLKEWGRKLIIVVNFFMLVFLASRYIPRSELLPLGYIFLNVIVLLYFMQSKIKRQFHAGRCDSWNRSILVIDDDEAIIKVVRPALLSHGYSVLTAISGEDGLQIASIQKPDLVLLDVILPGIKGREVCQKLKEDPQTQGIPVVFLTAKNSPEDIQAEKDVGSAGHITKPVDVRVLVETVQGALDSKEVRKKS
jgi:CheY-like chemotaxis protein